MSKGFLPFLVAAAAQRYFNLFTWGEENGSVVTFHREPLFTPFGTHENVGDFDAVRVRPFFKTGFLFHHSSPPSSSEYDWFDHLIHVIRVHPSVPFEIVLLCSRRYIFYTLSPIARLDYESL